MILANAINPFGLEFMDGTWLTVAIILMVIGLIIIGYFYDADDGPLVLLEAVCVFGMCVFWPVVLSLVIFCCVLALPILLGKWVRDGVKKRKKKKEEKLEFLNKVDKFKSEKL